MVNSHNGGLWNKLDSHRFAIPVGASVFAPRDLLAFQMSKYLN